MCGIAGVVLFEPSPESAADVARKMTAALVHRGPDGTSVWHAVARGGARIAFGHRRLAILDLTDAASQPMERPPLAITYNGEIFNFRALRAHLADRGVSFRSQSDTEVLLAAYAEWGARAVLRCDGMFAFGVWDGQREQLVLARDRFGVKPLYYYKDDRCFVFASEVRALLASGLVQASLSPEGLWHYLGYQSTPTPLTLLRGISMLEPGHTLTLNADGHMQADRYWDLLGAAGEVDGETSAERARTRVGELLSEAVTSHLVSDVPVGLFLSSGIDSGALVSSVKAAGITPRTLTVALEEEAYDESAGAGAVAAHFQTDHTEIRLKSADVVDLLPGLVRRIDHPSGDGVNSYVVSGAAREQGLKVALSGLGGDEVFGGYPSFRRLDRLRPALRQWRRSPDVVRRAAADMLMAAGRGSVTAMKAAAVAETDGSLAQTWPVTRQLFSGRERRRLLSEAWVRASGSGDRYMSHLRHAYQSAPASGDWARVSYAESRCYMHDVLLRDTDQMSMAHGLEVRVPLLDHRLAAYVVALPDRLKQGAGVKALLVDSLPLPLPRATRGAPKRGFTLPFDVWMRGPLRRYCEQQLLDDGLESRGMFRPGEVRALWTRFLNRAPGVTWSRLWALVTLNAWLGQQHVEVRP